MNEGPNRALDHPCAASELPARYGGQRVTSIFEPTDPDVDQPRAGSRWRWRRRQRRRWRRRHFGQGPRTPKPRGGVPSAARAFFDWVVVVGVALFVAIMVRTFLLAHFVVEGESMLSHAALRRPGVRQQAVVPPARPEPRRRRGAARDHRCQRARSDQAGHRPRGRGDRDPQLRRLHRRGPERRRPRQEARRALPRSGGRGPHDVVRVRPDARCPTTPCSSWATTGPDRPTAGRSVRSRSTTSSGGRSSCSGRAADWQWL